MHSHSFRTQVLLAAVALATALTAQGTPIGFEETFALSPDRAKAVATLITGSNDWYYYHCRERLDARDFATVRKLLPTWINSFGNNGRVLEIQNREALLSFADGAERTFAFLAHRFGYRYDHQRVVPGAKSDLPTRLDPALVAAAELTRRAFANSHDSVQGFSDAALPALAAQTLTPNQLRNLLDRLRRPDLDNLPALVVRDLDHRASGGFGSLEVHRQLRLEQLEECVRLRPALLREQRFVEACLVRMQPSADTTWANDPVALAAHLQQLHAFAQRLPSSFNSLKAHVLFHWLQHDLTQGAPDKERFLAYLRLPRRSGFPAEGHVQRFPRSEDHVNLGVQYATGLPPIGNDEAMVRACLEQFFASEDSYETYAEWLDANWLKTVLAETKLLLGQGDPERWYSMLANPTALEQIKQRIELTFPATMRTHYGADDAVTLALDAKNVPTLLVKVFAIDAYRYHQEKQKEVDAAIELDGIVANFEQTFHYTEVPLRRVRRTFDLPMLREPGTYVVEFVGNGTSSRAVIHKGGLRCVERTVAGGQMVRVYDERGAHVPTAAVWFGGVEYTANDKGEVLLPFSTAPGQKQIVLRAGSRSSMAAFTHLAESYQLHGAAFVDRESLIAGRTARIAIRPQLRLTGHDVALSLLENRLLTIVATDQDGLATTMEVRGMALEDEREFVHEIQVPERLQALHITLRGTVKDLAGKDVVCATATTSFAVNGIDATAETGTTMLLRLPTGYVVDARGKNGEAMAGRPCTVVLTHRDYVEPVTTTLQSDANGRILLGELPGIVHVRVQRLGGSATEFALSQARLRLPSSLHGRMGDTLRVPYQGTATSPTRAEFSLLGHRHDEFAHLAIADGFLELRELPPGDYLLLDHRAGDSIAVRITAGARDGSWLVGRDRVLASQRQQPLHLRAVQFEGDDVVIRLANATESTRVHVVATRALPTFDAFSHLLGAGVQPLTTFQLDRAESSYHAGRKLGDEYRYVLERRFAPKFVGNMLSRPSLLLSPWQVDDSKNQPVGFGRDGGGQFGGRAGARGPTTGGPAGPAGPGGTWNAGTFASFDYLPQGSVLLANLTPDADGVLRVKATDLGAGQQVHVLALDGAEAIYDTLVRAETPLVPRARTLAKALEGSEHFVEQRRIEFVAEGGTTVLDTRDAKVEMHDSLAGAFRLFSTISNSPDLAMFAFVTEWPKKSAAEKQTLYRQHACHELHFFLFHKDRAFFDTVVKPFLAQKLDKTFLDHWLLGDDLRAFVQPWQFAQLNLIERILLAQRLDGDGKQAVARTVREALELQPVSRERLNQLFDLALKSEELAEQPTLLDLDGFGAQELKAGAPSGPATGGPQRRGGQPGKAPNAPPSAKPVAAAEERKDKDSRERATEQEDAKVTGSDDFFLGAARRDELQTRGLAKQLFRAVASTKLLVEHNWWHRRMTASTADVVAPNRFWVDYATARTGTPFVSTALVEASGSFLEMMMALSVLDLPFEAGKHDVTVDGDRRTLKAATPLLLVRKEVTKTERAADQSPLLLGQNFFRLDDRYRTENGERRDAFVTDEFLVDVPYGCQVVVTNPTSSKRSVEVLLQIPAGAVPLQKGFWTKGVPAQLEPYATGTLEYAFYFPAAGTFAHYPAHAAEKGKLAANAEPRSLTVALTPSKVDTTSWEHVSQQGTAAEVLTFLDTHNVQGIDLSRIAWRMREREFFTQALAKLKSRHVYEHTLWSYGLLHRDLAATREHLQHADEFVQQCGMAITSPLLTIDPKERRLFEHIELDPLVHPRAHQLGGQRVLGNAALAQQYQSLMTLLGYHPQLDANDWLVVTYYLALQDRIEEALASFAKVDANKVATKVQYDYLAAYLCFFTGETAKARTLAEDHKDHPVLHWQQRFRNVLTQLDEAAGKTTTATGEPTADLAATAPALELQITERTIAVAHKNLTQCEVRYYELDVEFAFSAQPFASADGTAAAFVRPNFTETKDLPKGEPQLAFALPAQFLQKNVLVEVRAGGLVRSKQYFANALSVRFLESFGQVAVTAPDTQAPLPKTYVKVFAKLADGTVRFHKDGYTDLRGRFDYASLSDDPNANATRYAVLVLDEQRGAVIREIAPPTK